jgi:hypothetical protein
LFEKKNLYGSYKKIQPLGLYQLKPDIMSQVVSFSTTPKGVWKVNNEEIPRETTMSNTFNCIL